MRLVFGLLDGSTLKLHLHVQPGAKRTEIVGVHGDRLKIKVHAPPVDGKANEEICDFFSQLFTVAKRNVQVISGQTSRQKTLQIEELPANARETLQKLAAT
ncbi:MAG: DUF167 domain-containing protein [Bdellovibrionales bacterium]